MWATKSTSKLLSRSTKVPDAHRLSGFQRIPPAALVTQLPQLGCMCPVQRYHALQTQQTFPALLVALVAPACLHTPHGAICSNYHPPFHNPAPQIRQGNIPAIATACRRHVTDISFRHRPDAPCTAFSDCAGTAQGMLEASCTPHSSHVHQRCP